MSRGYIVRMDGVCLGADGRLPCAHFKDWLVTSLVPLEPSVTEPQRRTGPDQQTPPPGLLGKSLRNMHGDIS